ncbi:uncharacterized protein LY89DRAFT_737379 [Mollisia scopiformis]|uniref:Uncharacterized protein n=1 Tax=Mollisia scopiformis TaxID=149040 RepID=A0A194WZL9_MOLSC|nr:uncharacterized protein LY89DRAFT_737379 [Mollisia scopiformis]KUJ13396.1 hypothetical protein LY89DRAFT_737379 [Mollisia scopiformis]
MAENEIHIIARLELYHDPPDDDPSGAEEADHLRCTIPVIISLPKKPKTNDLVSATAKLIRAGRFGLKKEIQDSWGCAMEAKQAEVWIHWTGIEGGAETRPLLNADLHDCLNVMKDRGWKDFMTVKCFMVKPEDNPGVSDEEESQSSGIENTPRIDPPNKSKRKPTTTPKPKEGKKRRRTEEEEEEVDSGEVRASFPTKTTLLRTLPKKLKQLSREATPAAREEPVESDEPQSPPQKKSKLTKTKATPVASKGKKEKTLVVSSKKGPKGDDGKNSNRPSSSR